MVEEERMRGETYKIESSPFVPHSWRIAAIPACRDPTAWRDRGCRGCCRRRKNPFFPGCICFFYLLDRQGFASEALCSRTRGTLRDIGFGVSERGAGMRAMAQAGTGVRFAGQDFFDVLDGRAVGGFLRGLPPMARRRVVSQLGRHLVGFILRRVYLFDKFFFVVSETR